MTGVTLQLQPWQVEQLRAFADGEPHELMPRPDNLLRREFLMRVGAHTYRITPFGHDVLALAETTGRSTMSSPTTDPNILNVGGQEIGRITDRRAIEINTDAERHGFAIETDEGWFAISTHAACEHPIIGKFPTARGAYLAIEELDLRLDAEVAALSERVERA